MRLWRITNDDVYLEQSYVYLGSFFHNCEIWESEIELAVHWQNFLGATALHDSPCMAMYECFDSFAAFEHYLDDSEPELEPAARMLIAEYCKYALARAWFYYPDALPPEAAFIFATRAFHNIEGAPFRLYCDHFVRAMERTGEHSLTLTLDGGETCTASLNFVRLKRRTLPKSSVATVGGDVLRPRQSTPYRIDYRVPANGRIVLSWT